MLVIHNMDFYCDQEQLLHVHMPLLVPHNDITTRIRHAYSNMQPKKYDLVPGRSYPPVDNDGGGGIVYFHSKRNHPYLHLVVTEGT